MFTMRVTPKRSDRPAATKKSPEAAESPLSAWNRMALWVIAGALIPPPQVGPARLAHHSCGTRASPGFVGRAGPRPPRKWIARFDLSRSHPPAVVDGSPATRKGGNILVCHRPQFFHLGIGRKHRSAVHVLEVRHGAGALLERDRPHIGAHGGLMVAGAVGEGAERAVDFQALEGPRPASRYRSSRPRSCRRPAISW